MSALAVFRAALSTVTTSVPAITPYAGVASLASAVSLGVLTMLPQWRTSPVARIYLPGYAAMVTCLLLIAWFALRDEQRAIEDTVRAEHDVDEHERVVGRSDDEDGPGRRPPPLVHALDQRLERPHPGAELLEEVARARLFGEDVQHAVDVAVGAAGHPGVHRLARGRRLVPRLAGGREQVADALVEPEPALADDRALAEPRGAVVPRERRVEQRPRREVDPRRRHVRRVVLPALHVDEQEVATVWPPEHPEATLGRRLHTVGSTPGRKSRPVPPSGGRTPNPGAAEPGAWSTPPCSRGRGRSPRCSR